MLWLIPAAGAILALFNKKSAADTSTTVKRPPGPAQAPAPPISSVPATPPTRQAKGIERIIAAYPKSVPVASTIWAVAEARKVDPYTLANIIAYETGDSFSPTKENTGCVKKHGAGSKKCAMGLLQFTPTIMAELLGMKPEGPADARGNPQFTTDQKGAAVTTFALMTVVEQMHYVDAYIELQQRRLKNSLKDPALLALAVFYPSAVREAANGTLPASVREANPGISTPTDYVMKLAARSTLPATTDHDQELYALV